MDTVRRLETIKIFLWIFPFVWILALVIICAFKGMRFILLSIPVALPISIILTVIVDYISDKLGKTAGKLFTGGDAGFSIREQLTGVLNSARLAKREERFDAAIRIMEDILIQDPEFPEALFLKAQILVEGFNDTNNAKLCLSKVISLTKDNENNEHYRWAKSLYREIVSK